MDDVWKLLEEYDFRLNNIVNADLVCILCDKILIDPRVGPCGCRYCKVCIENYLKVNKNVCPGLTDECKEEYLSMIENINIDNFLNRKIAKLKLNCPIESCTFSDKIINMKAHLIVCKENAIECPLSENGCHFISLSKDNVDKHYKMNKDKHLQLVLSEIVTMKNNIDLITKNRKELQQENEKLQAVNVKYNDLLKGNQQISAQINKSQREIRTLKIANEKLQIENDDDKVKINQWSSSYNQLNEKNQIQSKQIIDYKTKYENEINNKNNLIKYLSECLIGNKTEFVWNINCFSQIRSKKKSTKFFVFKEDLWIELSMEYFNYNYELSLIASHHNNSLNKSCPFIFDFNIGIVDETSGNFVLSFSEKKAFTSSGISFKKEIEESQISKEIVNDCLKLKCLIRLSL